MWKRTESRGVGAAILEWLVSGAGSGWAEGLSCTHMKLEGCSSSFAGTVRFPEEKELETHPVVSRGAVVEVLVMFATTLSFKLLLDYFAGAPVETLRLCLCC